jgi:putative hydrolase of the HAD superfamily
MSEAALGHPPALLIDFGGVLTESVHDAFTDVCTAMGVDSAGFIAEAFGPGYAEDSPFALFELGRIDPHEFGVRLHEVLNRHADVPVDAHEWYAEVQLTTQKVDRAMVASISRIIAAGVPAALVSNSWGPSDGYPWARLPKFTEVVVSAEVGLRKPEPAIYLLAAERLNRDPADCLFIDDVEVNLLPARELGMATLLHRDTAETLAALQDIYGHGT